MKKILYFIVLAAIAFSCKPEAYVGDLDSPIGNWEGIGCDYYFKGDLVGDADSSYYSAMTFYKEGLCCIEGVKGAFPYSYDAQTHILQIDAIYWAVLNLHSEDMTLKYLGRTYATPPSTDSKAEGEDGNTGEDQGPEPDSNGIILPVEYRGTTIQADENDYYYMDNTGNKVYCSFVGQRNAEGLMNVALWYDTRTDYYVPMK
jgi:hypothetical protein